MHFKLEERLKDEVQCIIELIKESIEETNRKVYNKSEKRYTQVDRIKPSGNIDLYTKVLISSVVVYGIS